MGDGPHVEILDADEVVRIDCVEREVVGDSHCGDQHVESASCSLSSCRAQTGCDTTELACRRGIERDRFEVGLGLLHVRLPGGALLDR